MEFTSISQTNHFSECFSSCEKNSFSSDHNHNDQASTENIATTLKNLISLKKFSESVDYLMSDDHFRKIKFHTLHSLVDKLYDFSQVHVFSNLLILLIRKKSSLIAKYPMKRYFSLLAKSRKISLGHIVLDEFLQTYNEDTCKSLQMKVYQYYISAALKCSEVSLAVELLEKLKSKAVFSEDNSAIYIKIYEMLIKGCLTGENNLIEKGRALLEEIAIHHPPNIFFNKLIDFSAKHNDLSFSEYIFKVMVSNSIQPSIVTYNTLIDSYFKQSKFNQAWILFELLKKSDKKPDSFTYTSMINGIKSMDKPDLNRAFQLFNEYKQENKPDQIIYNCLIDACINAGNIDQVYELLKEMKSDPTLHLDEVSFNTLIKGCCKSKKLSQAITFFEEMKSMGISPNRITYNSLIDTCVKSGKMIDAWKFYDDMNKANIKSDNFTYSILISGIKANHSNKEDLNRALSLLEEVESNPDFKADEVFYNSLIDTCIKFDEINRGLSLFEEMKKKKIEPSEFTYGILIKAFGKINDLVKAFKVFEQMKLKQLKVNEVNYGCLLNACVKNSRMDLALILVEKMKQDHIFLNTILYTTLIKGFAKVNKLEEAFNIFELMKENPKTHPNLITYNCMIDVCVRCGDMEKALELFEELQHRKAFTPDLITYSTMIKGFCKQKNIEQAIDFLNAMMSAKVNPDGSLINQILEGCYITGQADQGTKIFGIMNSLKIPANEITYSTLIKLYGKTKKINKVMGVFEIIKKNRTRPSLIIYTNLIQACLKSKRMDYLLTVLQDFDNDQIRGDSIFFEKLVSGLLTMNEIKLGCHYVKKAINGRITLGQDVYSAILRELENQELPEKNEIISMIQTVVRGKNKCHEATLRENTRILNNPVGGFNENMRIGQPLDSSQNTKKFIPRKRENYNDKNNKENQWDQPKYDVEEKNTYKTQQPIKNTESQHRQHIGENKGHGYNGFNKSKKVPWSLQGNNETQGVFKDVMKNRFR